MMISAKQIYPRSGDNHTVYLNQVITNPNIIIGDYTMYHDFRKDPTLFEQNNVLYHYPINHDKLIIGKFLLYRMRYKIFIQQCQPFLNVFIHLSLSTIFRGMESKPM